MKITAKTAGAEVPEGRQERQAKRGTTGEERFDPITMGDSKNERLKSSLCGFLSAGGLVVGWAAASGRLTG